MSGSIDLESDAALSALVDGELAPEEERALRARVAADPRLAARLARFEALNRGLQGLSASDEATPGAAPLGIDDLAGSLAARIAADRSGSDPLGLDDGPPVFADERGQQSARPVVEFAARRRALRIALPLAAAIAAALLAYAVVSRPGPGAPAGDDAGRPPPQLAHDGAGGGDPPGVAPRGPEGSGVEPRNVELHGAPNAPAPPLAPSQLASAEPAKDADAAAGPHTTAAAQLAAGGTPNAEASASSADPGVDESSTLEAEALELYALALDEEVVGPDFDVIDNLELLEVLALLEAGGPRG